MAQQQNGDEGRWAVVAIDWHPPNVIGWYYGEIDAQKAAEGFDSLALRAVAVPEGHPMIKE